MQVNFKDDLLLTRCVNELTAWDIAAEKATKDISEKLWCWGREAQVNLKDYLLLAKSFNGLTACDIAAEKAIKDIL